MPKYFYKCPDCNHFYIEQRLINDKQVIEICNSCGKANYEKVTE